jgi:hypothetical protein
MTALATRAERVQQGDYSVTSLPMTGAVGQQFDTWVDAAVSGDQMAALIWQEKTLLGAGYDFVRSMMSGIDDQPVTWNERVLVFHSLTLAQSQVTALEKRLQRATAHQEVTLTKVVVGQQVQWHLTPLPDLILNTLRHLGLSPTAYMRLVGSSG